VGGAGHTRGLGSLRKIAAALLAIAAGGDVPAINALADRTDGKVAQALIGDREPVCASATALQQRPEIKRLPICEQAL
jgi:hypothetical protein